MTTERRRTALLSVWDKTGIVEFAAELLELGFDVIASGGTYDRLKGLRESGLPIRSVAEIVGGGAILGHKVVTLSRKLMAGILADTNSDEEMRELETLGVPVIDLVYVNMYPLRDEILKEGSTRESVIKNTDIGGPTMLSASAKARRITMCDPHDRERVLEWLTNGEPDHDAFITGLSAKADMTVCIYRAQSAVYHGGPEMILKILDGLNLTPIAQKVSGESR